jgi:hypothetical protein
MGLRGQLLMLSVRVVGVRGGGRVVGSPGGVVGVGFRGRGEGLRLVGGVEGRRLGVGRETGGGRGLLGLLLRVVVVVVIVLSSTKGEIYIQSAECFEAEERKKGEDNAQGETPYPSSSSS